MFLEILLRVLSSGRLLGYGPPSQVLCFLPFLAETENGN